MNAPSVSLQSLPGLPIVKPGDNLASLIVASLNTAAIALLEGDILVVTSKIVSKAEGRFLDLRTVTPGDRAQEIAGITGKDPRMVEVVLQESEDVSRIAFNVLVTRHKLGFTSANAGIDHSNVGPNGEDWILLLPVDPDASAAKLRDGLRRLTGASVGIVISDTHGRPHRMGNIGVGIGAAGLPALYDMRGMTDLFGRVLQATVIGLADELAAAADLLSGQAAEGRPVTLIRGLKLPPIEGRARDLIRPPELDLYR
ncbi:MAG TPA: coenzyme F420-0:L-glutamate ligase [Aggregatilineales bacterium]|nr:coenzyme F420-0:L-glutamate ligase [Aggregatilineales bacterium]